MTAGDRAGGDRRVLGVAGVLAVATVVGRGAEADGEVGGRPPDGRESQRADPRVVGDGGRARRGAWRRGRRWVTILFGAGLVPGAARDDHADADAAGGPSHAVLGVLRDGAGAVLRWSTSGGIGMFSIFIPVYGFLFLAIRSTLTGDYKDYLDGRRRSSGA